MERPSTAFKERGFVGSWPLTRALATLEREFFNLTQVELRRVASELSSFALTLSRFA